MIIFLQFLTLFLCLSCFVVLVFVYRVSKKIKCSMEKIENRLSNLEKTFVYYESETPQPSSIEYLQ
jgi:uncharacterized protein YoxC